MTLARLKLKVKVIGQGLKLNDDWRP